MSRKKPPKRASRRSYDDDFKAETVQMLLDGHPAQSIVDRLGISGTNLLYRWKKQRLADAGPPGEVLDSRVQELESELRCVEREREVCGFLDFTRPPFQRWKQFELSPLEEEDKRLLPWIAKSFHAHRRRYGSRRIMDDLRDQGFPPGRRRVAKLMKIAGLSAIQPKSFKPGTTESKHALGDNENLIKGFKELQQPNHLRVGDITCIPIQEIGFGYLAVLMDRFSRSIVGWELGTDMTEQIVITSLKMAIKTRRPNPGLIHHTDRGGQYAAKEYRKIIKRAAMKQSMSRAGDCYDNAFMESCFGTIKTELEMTEYKNYNEALRDIRSYFTYYNFERKHSAIGYQTPNQVEQNFSLNQETEWPPKTAPPHRTYPRTSDCLAIVVLAAGSGIGS